MQLSLANGWKERRRRRRRRQRRVEAEVSIVVEEREEKREKRGDRQTLRERMERERKMCGNGGGKLLLQLLCLLIYFQLLDAKGRFNR